jgi:hypothetical protein
MGTGVDWGIVAGIRIVYRDADSFRYGDLVEMETD